MCPSDFTPRSTIVCSPKGLISKDCLHAESRAGKCCHDDPASLGVSVPLTTDSTRTIGEKNRLMASLTVLSSPNASTNNNTFLLTTASTTTTAVAKIAPKRTTARRNRPASPPSARGPSVARRNERERNRVRQVNLGFATLRQHVPNRSKKMSKVETLRSAVQYIRQLQSLLGETSSDADDCCGADENCGGVPAFAEAFARTQPHLETLASAGAATGASASSPAPSLGSDASSPYDSLSPEDEELIDFTTWLS